MIEYKFLNPQTLEEDPNGERYQIQTIGSSVIISACPLPDPNAPISEQQPIQPTNQELRDNQLILMDALATMFEAMMEKGTV
jgi:hypothetical protein